MRNWTRQAVVTGMGIVCNMGDDLDAVAAQVRAGKNKPFSRWQPAVDINARCQIIGQYEGDLSNEVLGIDKKQARFMTRASRLALRAARTALRQADLQSSDVGVVVGSGTGDVDTHIAIQRLLQKNQDARKTSPAVIPKIMASSVSANLSNALRFAGPSVSATAACAGGAYNILIAAQFIESGHMDAAIAGGIEGQDVHFHAGFDAMRAYNSRDNDSPERASRPYAADRRGFVYGEGGGILVIESLEHALARGAQILGAIGGFGMSSDGQGNMVAPAQSGAARAVRAAIKHAELGLDAIGYVNTHGTSTPVGDVSEVRALRDVFGDQKIPYSSTKGYTGHAISGAGAIEAMLTLRMLSDGWLAPSVHAEPLDEALLDYPPVLAPTDRAIDHALSNSFGFGGTNVTLALSRVPRER